MLISALSTKFDCFCSVQLDAGSRPISPVLTPPLFTNDIYTCDKVKPNKSYSSESDDGEAAGDADDLGSVTGQSCDDESTLRDDVSTVRGAGDTEDEIDVVLSPNMEQSDVVLSPNVVESDILFSPNGIELSDDDSGEEKAEEFEDELASRGEMTAECFLRIL